MDEAGHFGSELNNGRAGACEAYRRGQQFTIRIRYIMEYLYVQLDQIFSGIF